jgi:protein tyrosine kinase modulator
MTEEPKNLLLKPKYIFEIIRRRRWYILFPFFIVICCGIGFAIVSPNKFSATTLILVQPERAPLTSMESNNFDEQINTLTQQILSSTNLEKIIEDYALFQEAEDEEEVFLEDKVNKLRERIEIMVSRDRRDDTTSFSISYKGKDPQKVMDITNTLASNFINENLKILEDQVAGTSSFLEAELVETRKKLERHEIIIEKFRKQYMGELPEQLDGNLRILDQLQTELTQREASARDARSRLVTLQSQSTPPPAALTVGGTPQTDPLDPQALRAELARLEMRYTDKHPDVIKLRNQIIDLENKIKSGEIPSATGSSDGDAEAPSSIRESPEIIAQRNEIRSLDTSVARIRSQIREYQKRVANTPSREQELLALKRDYQNLQDSYNSLLDRKLDADISVNMERSQKGDKFRIVDHARLPRRPIEPNLLQIFLMTIAAGLAAAGGLVFLLEIMDSSFRYYEDIEDFFDLPIAATVPFLENRRSKVLKLANTVFTALFVLLTGALLVGFASLPLNGVDKTLKIIKDYIAL